MKEESNPLNRADQLDFLSALPSKAPQEESMPSSDTMLPEKLLIVDTETTGLDPDIHECLEIGAILFDVKSRSVLAQQSFLLPVLENGAEKINRIPAEITQISQPWQAGLTYLDSLIQVADVMVAHNVAFDRQWFGKEPLPKISKNWICSMEDITWPSSLNIRIRPSVRDLALAYGVPVWNAHRALTDCIYLSEVLSRCDNLEELLIQGLQPRVLMRAQVSYDQRQLAKNAGFRWNDPVVGAWSRRLTNQEASELDFEVVPVLTED